jgi:hypothetical protein
MQVGTKALQIIMHLLCTEINKKKTKTLELQDDCMVPAINFGENHIQTTEWTYGPQLFWKIVPELSVHDVDPLQSITLAWHFSSTCGDIKG